MHSKRQTAAAGINVGAVPKVSITVIGGDSDFHQSERVSFAVRRFVLIKSTPVWDPFRLNSKCLNERTKHTGIQTEKKEWFMQVVHAPSTDINLSGLFYGLKKRYMVPR